MWGLGSHRRGLDLIPSSSSGKVLPFILGISLKASARAERSPWDRNPCVGRHLSLQGLWDSLAVAEMPVAFQPCPKMLLQALGAIQEDTGTLHFLWSQIPCSLQGNLPLGRSGHKAWMSGMVLGKAGSCPGLCESSGSLLSSLPTPAPLTASQGEPCRCLCHGSPGSWEQPALQVLSEILFIFKILESSWQEIEFP